MEIEPVKLCRECYKRMLSFQMAVPIWEVEKFLEKLLGIELVPVLKNFEFTPDHDKCENCPSELRRMGYDPCAELLIFRHDIEGDWSRKLPLLRLFAWYKGFDAVSEDGNYLQMLDPKIHELFDD